MFHPTEDFHKYIHPGKRVHLAGIGGVSMCALAEVLQGMGVTVQGSDMSESDTVKHLRSVGIPVAIGHSAENLKNCDAVIRTAAIHDSNPEIAGAVARGIPVYERAQAWGAIMQGYRNALCDSGPHGKPTATSMAFFRWLRQVFSYRAISGKAKVITMAASCRANTASNSHKNDSFSRAIYRSKPHRAATASKISHTGVAFFQFSPQARKNCRAT